LIVNGVRKRNVKNANFEKPDDGRRTEKGRGMWEE